MYFYTILMAGVAWYTVTLSSTIPMTRFANKRYNEVMYATTHNGQSHVQSPVCNQDQSITEQLKAGIRAIKIPVWSGLDEEGKEIPYACHGISKKILQEAYLGSLINKVPRLFRPFAQKILENLQPIDQMVVDALMSAYGENDADHGAIPFNHAILDPAARPLRQVFVEIYTFLEANKTEVVTLILEEFMNNRAVIANEIHASGLYSYLHTQLPTEPWPTLGEMIKANTRLVVFVRSEDKQSLESFPWLHDLWTFAWDTCWDFKRMTDFNHDIVPNRGQTAFALRNQPPYNKLFIVYHFITPYTGGSKHWARRVNRASILEARIKMLREQTGYMPNFIQVDFFEQPNNDVIRVVNAHNAVVKK
jgi:hypothetical protein